MERPPLALKRLTLLEDGRVHYQGARVHPGLGRDHQLMTGLEFLALLVPHVALRYQVTIRNYGAIATTYRKRLGWIAPRPASEACGTCAHGAVTRVASCGRASGAATPNHGRDADPEFVRVRKRNWAYLIRKVWMVDPEVCGRCGKTMRIIAALASPAQDDVIRKILDCRGEWDPPWLKPRARPPPATVNATREVVHDEHDQRVVDHDADYNLFDADLFIADE